MPPCRLSSSPPWSIVAVSRSPEGAGGAPGAAFSGVPLSASAACAVVAVGTAADAREALALTAYDAAVLDLGLPDGDGLALLAGLRRRGSAVPVLVLTARDAVEDRVAGLNTGADDYLVKPFAMAELVARAKALPRRPGHALGLALEAGNGAPDTVR